MTTIVQLRVAKIPVIGFIAVHYWWVVSQGTQCDRWEVWQRAECGKKCWGHLHKNLMAPEQGVGNGDSWREYQWSGQPAEQLREIIKTSPQHYPHNYLYRYYPGPNSNTYVQWVLDQCAMDYALGSKGLGKNYR